MSRLAFSIPPSVEVVRVACPPALHTRQKLPMVRVKHLFGVWVATTAHILVAKSELQKDLWSSKSCDWSLSLLLGSIDVQQLLIIVDMAKNISSFTSKKLRLTSVEKNIYLKPARARAHLCQVAVVVKLILDLACVVDECKVSLHSGLKP